MLATSARALEQKKQLFRGRTSLKLHGRYNISNMEGTTSHSKSTKWFSHNSPEGEYAAAAQISIH